MRFVHFENAGVPGIAVENGSGWHGLTAGERGFPGTLPELMFELIFRQLIKHLFEFVLVPRNLYRERRAAALD